MKFIYSYILQYNIFSVWRITGPAGQRRILNECINVRETLNVFVCVVLRLFYTLKGVKMKRCYRKCVTYGWTDGRTDPRTDPLIEMRWRIQKEKTNYIHRNFHLHNKCKTVGLLLVLIYESDKASVSSDGFLILRRTGLKTSQLLKYWRSKSWSVRKGK